MEMSHRGALFQEIHDSAKAKLKALMEVPDTHEILLLQGGATAQFAAIPMNLIEGGTADYAVTGQLLEQGGKGSGEVRQGTHRRIDCRHGL